MSTAIIYEPPVMLIVIERITRVRTTNIHPLSFYCRNKTGSTTFSCQRNPQKECIDTAYQWYFVGHETGVARWIKVAQIWR